MDALQNRSNSLMEPYHAQIWKVFAAITTLFVVNCAVKASRARLYARSLQRRGLPMPPHNIVLGHLGIVASITRALPSDAHAHYLADQIRQRYPELSPTFYLDLWPFSDLMLVVTDPAMIAQFCQPDQLLPKHPGVKRFMYPITGGYDLNCLDGGEWKLWRRLFNPGFSSGHMLTLVPSIVEEAVIFRDILKEKVRDENFFLFENLTLNLTLDVIGRVALDAKLNTQRAHNPMISALLAQRKWAAFSLGTDFWTVVNPLRYFHIWNNTRIMDKYINHELDQRYLTSSGTKGSKTIIDLALKGYDAEAVSTKRVQQPLDATFRKYALSQMKVFIFAGHDTTSTTICYSWLLLSRNSEALARLRAEHDNVLGPDTSKAASKLTENPALLNQLPYTLAVIKETLRIFPAVSSPRMGQPGFPLVDSQQRQFPTEHCLVWASHHGLHHNPLWWKQVEDFIPERFLHEQDNEIDPDLRPIKNAWRPFEFGPRACIGTELALAEVKVVLALTTREFDLEEAYVE